jgi:serine O-acetyltransferase
MSVENNEESDTIRDAIWQLLRSQAHDICTREPLLEPFVVEAILQHSSFKSALINRLAHKLSGEYLTMKFFINIFQQCLQNDIENILERYAMEDLIAVEENDPACFSIAQVFLYSKGYSSIQAYRCSHILWVHNHTDLALLIQSRSTEIFGVDIHPGAIIGSGLMIDHGTGVVIGETTVIGKNCSFLHGITLGGTGGKIEQSRDRHPKIGDSVFLGCNVTVLGNIRIGDHSRVGASSLVLTSLPPGSTAVGSPAVIKSIHPPSINEASDWAVPADEDRTAVIQFDSDCRPNIKLWSKIWYPKTWPNHPLKHCSIRECFEYSWSDYKI